MRAVPSRFPDQRRRAGSCGEAVRHRGQPLVFSGFSPLGGYAFDFWKVCFNFFPGKRLLVPGIALRRHDYCRQAELVGSEVHDHAVRRDRPEMARLRAARAPDPSA